MALQHQADLHDFLRLLYSVRLQNLDELLFDPQSYELEMTYHFHQELKVQDPFLKQYF